MSKDTGFKALKRSDTFNFLKWGEYMKRANIAERKLEKLKALVLLVDPVVSHIEMNELSATQWSEYVKEFPEELNDNEN